MSFEPILLAPEEIIEEVFPYRRIWRTSWTEIIMLAMLVAAIWVASALFGLVPDSSAPLPRMALALAPLAGWLFFSYIGERRAQQPRPFMVGMLVLGGLVANAIAIPLEENLFEPDTWLPMAGFFGRAIGFALTVGITTAFLIYLVMRYTVWPNRIRTRQDGIAYALAIAVGYATIYNARTVFYTDITLVPTALRIASITFSHLAIGTIIGFFITEMVIGRVPVFWMPFGLGFAALVGGLYYAFRAVAIVGGLNIDGTGSSPIRGLALAFGLVALVYLIVAFITENADQRDRHATGRQEPL